jgi:hypothetical protein
MKATWHNVYRMLDRIHVDADFPAGRGFYFTVCLDLHDDGSIQSNVKPYREDGTEHPAYRTMLTIAENFRLSEKGAKQKH